MAQSSPLVRVFSVLPFLFFTAICALAFQQNTVILEPWFEAKKQHGIFEWSTGSFPIWSSFWRIAVLDELWRVVVIAFIPSTFEVDPVSWWQMFSFLADAGVVYAIWIIEANRVANKRTIAYFPGVIAQIYQIVGGGIVAPFYYIGDLLSAPRASSLTESTRRVNLASMRILLPSMVLMYYVPFLGAYLATTLQSRHWWTWLWQMFPIWIGISQFLLSRVFPTVPLHDHAELRPREEWVYIRATIGTVCGFSALFWLYTFTSAPYSMLQIFIPSALREDEPLDALRTMLQYDHLTFLGAALLWIAYLGADLKVAGMKKDNIASEVAMIAASSIVLGPGATIGLFWLRREQLLVAKTREVPKSS